MALSRCCRRAFTFAREHTWTNAQQGWRRLLAAGGSDITPRANSSQPPSSLVALSYQWPLTTQRFPNLTLHQSPGGFIQIQVEGSSPEFLSEWVWGPDLETHTGSQRAGLTAVRCGLCWLLSFFGPQSPWL